MNKNCLGSLTLTSNMAQEQQRTKYDRQDTTSHLTSQDKQEPEDDDSPCELCSFKQQYPEIKAKIFHEHESSRHERVLMGIEDSTENKPCSSCKSTHPPYPDVEGRIKLIVTDYLLHKFYASANYPGDQVHTDYISIKDGITRDLHRAVMLEVGSVAKPLDVVIACGYNDLIKGHDRDYIIEGLTAFSKEILDLKTKHNLESSNTVAICTLVYPPALASFISLKKDNGTKFARKLKIYWINEQIHELNKKNNCPYYPRLHTFGVKKNTRRTYDELGRPVILNHKVHRMKEWDGETELELQENVRFEISRKISGYLLART